MSSVRDERLPTVRVKIKDGMFVVIVQQKKMTPELIAHLEPFRHVEDRRAAARSFCGKPTKLLSTTFQLPIVTWERVERLALRGFNKYTLLMQEIRPMLADLCDPDWTTEILQHVLRKMESEYQKSAAK